MPGRNYRQRAFGFFLAAALGTGLLVLAIARFPEHEEMWLLVVGVFASVPMWTLGCVSLWTAVGVDTLHRKGGALARWTLTPQAQDAHAEAVYTGEKSLPGALIGGGLLVCIALAFKLLAPQAMEWSVFLLIMLGLLALVLFVALGLPWLTKRRIRRDPPHVAIGLYSAALPGQYVIWHRRQMGMMAERVIAVALEQDDAGDALTIKYEVMKQGGYVKRSCHIPVPDGKRAEAEDAGRKIAEACGIEFHNKPVDERNS